MNTEPEYKRKEKLEEFRAQIIAAVDYDVFHKELEVDVDNDCAIRFASNGKGAWVQAYIWVDRENVKGDWLEDVENPPGVEECIEALRSVLREAPPAVPHKTVKAAMSLIARYQGKNSWMDAIL